MDCALVSAVRESKVYHLMHLFMQVSFSLICSAYPTCASSWKQLTILLCLLHWSQARALFKERKFFQHVSDTPHTYPFIWQNLKVNQSGYISQNHSC